MTPLSRTREGRLFTVVILLVQQPFVQNRTIQ